MHHCHSPPISLIGIVQQRRLRPRGLSDVGSVEGVPSKSPFSVELLTFQSPRHDSDCSPSPPGREFSPRRPPSHSRDDRSPAPTARVCHLWRSPLPPITSGRTRVGNKNAYPCPRRVTRYTPGPVDPMENNRLCEIRMRPHIKPHLIPRTSLSSGTFVVKVLGTARGTQALARGVRSERPCEYGVKKDTSGLRLSSLRI
jgi:hypothetical protein